jgi:hypothetical protein
VGVFFYPQIPPIGADCFWEAVWKSQALAACASSVFQPLFFYPQIPPIGADCFWEAVWKSKALAACASSVFRLLFFYPQIPQIVADYGGLSCRCAAIHAA